MAHAQKPNFVFWRSGLVHLNRQRCHFSRLLAAEVGASAVVMLDTPSSEVVWRVLPTHTIRQFSLHFPSRASPCAITFQLGSTTYINEKIKTRLSFNLSNSSMFCLCPSKKKILTMRLIVMKISSLLIKMTCDPPTLNFKIILFPRVNFEFAKSRSRLKDTNKEVKLSLHMPRRYMEE